MHVGRCHAYVYVEDVFACVKHALSFAAVKKRERESERRGVPLRGVPQLTYIQYTYTCTAVCNMANMQSMPK